MQLDKVIMRSKVVKLIREFFDNQGFTEMLTPRLVGLPGQEPYLEPFATEINTEYAEKSTEYAVRSTPSPVLRTPYSVPAFLITSPEYAMKRLLAQGMDKIYDLGSCFRNNEPWDGTHDPEFLMIEWYRRDSGVDQLMDDTEQMIRYVALRIQNSKFKIQKSTFRRITVEQAWREYVGVELAPLLGNREAISELASTRFNQTITSDDDWDDIYFKIFLSHIEPKLGWSQNNQDHVPSTLYPTFLHRYPASQASLARKCADDPRWAERVELYIGDLELANGFAELCDADEQRKRFLEERALRSKQGKKTWALDERFLSDLPKMGNAAGIAFGVDRLVMLLTDSKSINDVLPFPPNERFVV